MIKRVLTVFIICMLIAICACIINKQLLDTTTRFSIDAVYSFHAIATFTIYLTVNLVYKNLPNQAGYVYLISVFIKMGVFVLLFNTSVFALDALTKPEKTTLIIPLFLFLFTEAFLITKLLNLKED